MYLIATNPDGWNIGISIALLILAYLLGSIPFGLIIGKLATGVDLREHGSKNIGSTNAVRVLGKKVGAIVFICDILKGAIILIVLRILQATGTWDSCIALGFYGAMSAIGHSYSCFLKFKGGKAVATSLGVAFVLCPVAAIVCLIVFIVTVKTTGYVSLGSTFGMITVVLLFVVFCLVGIYTDTFLDAFTCPHWLDCIAVAIPASIILYKHIPNYKRLANGTENSFKKKKETPVEEKEA